MAKVIIKKSEIDIEFEKLQKRLTLIAAIIGFIFMLLIAMGGK